MHASSRVKPRAVLQDYDVTAAVLYLVSWSLLDLVLYFQYPSGYVAPWYATHALSLALLSFLGLRFWPLIFLGSFLNGYFLWFDGRLVPVTLLAIGIAVLYGSVALYWQHFRKKPRSTLQLVTRFMALSATLSLCLSAGAYLILSRDQLIAPAEPLQWMVQLSWRDTLDIWLSYPFAIFCLMPLGQKLMGTGTPSEAAAASPQILPRVPSGGVLALLFLLPVAAWTANNFLPSPPLYVGILPLLALTYIYGLAGASAGLYSLYALYYPVAPFADASWSSEPLLTLLCLGAACLTLAHFLEKQARSNRERLARLEQQAADLQKALLQSEQGRQQMQKLHENIERMILRSAQEMRTPLTPIFIWAQMLQDSSNRKSVVEASTAIQENIERQTRLLDELNDTLRLSTGKLKLHIETVELNSLLQAIVASLRPLAEQRALRLFLSPESGPEYVLGDREQLQAALTKLLDHVLRYGQTGSSVSIIFSRQHRETLLHIKHTGYGSDQKNVLQMLNAGAGMDEESFLTSSNFDLGLYVARKLIEMQGGYLTAASLQPKPGVLFSLTLRKAHARNTAHLPTETRPLTLPGEGRTLSLSRLPIYWQDQHILVVEDDPFTLQLLTQVLQSEGLKTVGCKNASEALDAFHRYQPALVIADLGLPDINGFELIRRFKKTSRREFTAVAFSACVSPEAQNKAMEAGFSAFLAKPLQVRELLQTLEALLAHLPAEVKRG